jgi:hypothetical protein
VHFEDGPTERVTDRAPLPLPRGAYGCAAALCEAPRFAETELAGHVSS